MKTSNKSNEKKANRTGMRKKSNEIKSTRKFTISEHRDLQKNNKMIEQSYIVFHLISKFYKKEYSIGTMKVQMKIQ